MGAVAVAAAVAEVDAAGELADDEQVGAGDPLARAAGWRDQRRAGPDRAQVRVEAQPLAQAEQALLGARRVGVGRVPLRAADGAEQDRVGGPAGLEHPAGERDAVGVDRGAAERLIGGCSIDEHGTALTDEVLDACRDADAVLLGAVGGPKWDTTDPDAPRPEQGLLGLRKGMGLYANLRPVRPSPALVGASPLRRSGSPAPTCSSSAS